LLTDLISFPGSFPPPSLQVGYVGVPLLKCPPAHLPGRGGVARGSGLPCAYRFAYCPPIDNLSSFFFRFFLSFGSGWPPQWSGAFGFFFWTPLLDEGPRKVRPSAFSPPFSLQLPGPRLHTTGQPFSFGCPPLFCFSLYGYGTGMFPDGTLSFQSSPQRSSATGQRSTFFCVSASF